MQDESLAAFVAGVGVEWLHRPVPAEPQLAQRLMDAALDDTAKAEVADAVTPLMADEIARHGYHTQDLIVLHPGTPGLEDMLVRFDMPHTHSDDEVRYILDGEGLFGFFDAEGRERVVRVTPGDYLRIPAGVEHRFTLTPSRRIKALRLFADTAGWVADYTGRPAPKLETLAP